MFICIISGITTFKKISSMKIPWKSQDISRNPRTKFQDFLRGRLATHIIPRSTSSRFHRTKNRSWNWIFHQVLNQRWESSNLPDEFLITTRRCIQTRDLPGRKISHSCNKLALRSVDKVSRVQYNAWMTAHSTITPKARSFCVENLRNELEHACYTTTRPYP